MALGKDIKKIINSNVEISKVLHQGKVIWQSGLDLSDPNLWEQGGFSGSSGNPMTTSIRIRTKDYMQIEGTKVKMSVNAPYTVAASYYKADNTMVPGGDRAREITENVPATATKTKISIGKDGNADITPSELANTNIKLEFL